MVNIDFNVNEYESDSQYAVIPAGWYSVLVQETERKPTRANDGFYLQVTLQVLSGTHKGRLIWDRMNLWNKSETASDIARKHLRQLSDAAVPEGSDLKNTTQLHNSQVEARLIVRPPKGNYEESNEVKEYRKIGSESAATGVTAGAEESPVDDDSDFWTS